VTVARRKRPRTPRQRHHDGGDHPVVTQATFAARDPLAYQVGLTPALIGLLFTIGAIGGLVGSLAAAPLARRVGTPGSCGARRP
jgi:hypothetical protein